MEPPLERWGVTVPSLPSAGGSLAGPAYDRLWLGPFAALASVSFVALGDALGPAATLALYVAFNALFNLPHQFCTWVRAFDEEGPVPRSRWAWIMALALLVAVTARAVPSAETVLLTNLLPYWGMWHLCAQHYGITRIYRRRTAGDTGSARWDRGFFLALFAMGLLRAHAATDLTFRVGASTTTMWRLPFPEGHGRAISLALGVAFVALSLARVLWSRRTNPARAGFEGFAAAATFVGFFGTDDVMITTAAITSLHNIHYLGLVRFHRAARARLDPTVKPLGARALAGAYAYSVAVHAVFLASAFAGQALLAALVASHYLVDASIWRVRRMPELTGSLRLPA